MSHKRIISGLVLQTSASLDEPLLDVRALHDDDEAPAVVWAVLGGVEWC